jgi:ATP-dependent phosphoenolpyruvate carboxykinase
LRPTIYRGLRLVTIIENVTASNDLPWFEALTITENVTASNDLPWFEAS